MVKGLHAFYHVVTVSLRRQGIWKMASGAADAQESQFYEVNGGFWPLLRKRSVGKTPWKLSTSFSDLFSLMCCWHLSTWTISLALSNPREPHHLRQILQTPSISPFSNSTEAIYHPAEQIPTPAPLKTDLQFSVKWRCFFSLLFVIFPFVDEQWLQGPSIGCSCRQESRQNPQRAQVQEIIHYPNLSNPYQRGSVTVNRNQEEALYRALCLSRFGETLIKILQLPCAD